MNLLEAAFRYRGLGWSPIPVSRINKQPKLGKGYLEKYSKQLPSDEELQAWFRDANGDVAIAVITPPNILAIDIDGKELFNLVSRLDPQEKAKQTLVHSTPRGYRIFVRVPDGILTKKVEARFPGDHRSIELKPGGLGYSIVPPAQGYESLSTWDQQLQVLNEDQAKTLIETIKLYGRFANLIDSLANVWVEGCRHGLAGALAGTLRKSGLKQQEAETIIEAICSLSHDAETEDRLRFVRDTFEKPLDQVAGVSKLREILASLVGEAEAERIIESLKPRRIEDQAEEFNVKIIAEEIMTKFKIITSMDRNEEIYVYQGGIFIPGEALISSEVQRLLQENYSRYRCQEVLDYIRKSTYARIEEAPVNLICLENGILNLETGELRPHSPDFVFFNKLPVAYDPNAKCPNIEKFLGEIVDPDDRPCLEEIVGYCLYRSYPIQKIFLLTGQGGNGRSTFLNLVITMLGKQNVSARSLQELETDKFATADLFGKLANIHPDIPSKILFSTGMIKTLTGGDLVKAERKFGHSFTFYNYAKLIFSANQVPETLDDSDALFRRMFIVNFPHQFTGDRADKRLLEKLTTPGELSGFLNLALAGLRRLLKQGDFSNAKTIEETREEYKRKASPVYAFVSDCCEVDSTAWVSKDDLYASFLEYCRVKKIPALSRETFFKHLPLYATVSYDRVKQSGALIRIVRGLRILERPRPETLSLEASQVA